MEDLEMNRNRSIEDADTQNVRTQEALDRSMAEVQTNIDRQTAMAEKMGAISGKGRSSGRAA